MADSSDKDIADDLFEPFELDDYPTEDEGPPPAAPEPTPEPAATSVPAHQVADPQATTVRCPSCGSVNPSHNRHCEECGARLAQGPLPVAPAPLSRSTAGGKALAVLTGVVLMVALIALFLNIFGGEDGTPLAGADDAVTTTAAATSATAAATELVPASVEASSELPPSFVAANLIDGDTATYWNDASQQGVDATLTFTFGEPVAIGEIEMQNIIDDTSFRQNWRIRDMQITVDDLQLELSYTMPDNNEPYRQALNTLETRRLTITVLSTYPGEPVGDNPSFQELGLAEVRFFGTVTEQ